MILAVDTETTGLDIYHGCKPFLITACDGFHNYYSFGKVNPYNRLEVVWDEEVVSLTQERLEQATKLIFHNAKFDLKMLESIGIDLEPLWGKIEDTLLASHCLCSGESHNLKYLAFKYLDYPEDDEDNLSRAVQAQRLLHPEYDQAKLGHKAFPGLSNNKTSWYKMDYWMCPDECLTYGIGDVERTWLLWQMFYDALESHQLRKQYNTRKELIRIAYDMENVGYNMYADSIREEVQYLTHYRQTLTEKILRSCKIKTPLDLDKEKDKRFFLFSILELEPSKYSEKTGIPSLDKDSIQYMVEDNPDVAPLQDYQSFRIAGTQINAMQSYLKWVCNDNRIRANVFITGTRNTRQSYTDPNLQSLDKRLHHVFGPPQGYVWLDYDLVNIELRIWVYQVGNQELLEIFESGQSVHLLIGSITRPELFNALGPDKFKDRIESPYNEYTKTKNGTFAIIYGASEKAADGPRGYGVFGAYKKVIERFPEVGSYSQKIMDEMWYNFEVNHAPYVTCLGGYRLDVDTNDAYIAPNTKIQGTAGWIMTEAMINIKHNPDYISTGSQMVCQTHDSIKIEVPIKHYNEALKLSLQKSIEDAGLKYLPTCKSSCHVIHNEEAPF